MAASTVAGAGNPRVVQRVNEQSRSALLAFAGGGANCGAAGARAHWLAHRRPSVVVPPSDIGRHFGDLLAGGEGADVTFDVGGEAFAAHRCVLAARSAVFRAELFGAMKEATATTTAIKIEDMEPRVFAAMLRYMYTDSLPAPETMTETEEDEEGVVDGGAMWQHLLVAADRYGLRRLRLMCEEKLCEHIDVSTAAAVLALAEQHHCDGLKEACLEFLKYPSNLRRVMAADGLDHLIACCPSVLKDLIAKLVF